MTDGLWGGWNTVDVYTVELSDLARLALQGDRRDVELFVHRMAYRHRGTPLGDRLAGLDMVPPVALRVSDGG